MQMTYIRSLVVATALTLTINPLAVADGPPDCSTAEANQTTLWPPNGRMKKVRITNVRDPDTGIGGFTIKITGVSQDEPVSGAFESDRSPDANILSENRRKQRFELRAERNPDGNGRVYKVDFIADDGSASCEGSVEVWVPQRRNGPAESDGALYDSTGTSF